MSEAIYAASTKGGGFASRLRALGCRVRDPRHKREDISSIRFVLADELAVDPTVTDEDLVSALAGLLEAGKLNSYESGAFYSLRGDLENNVGKLTDGQRWFANLVIHRRTRRGRDA